MICRKVSRQSPIVLSAREGSREREIHLLLITAVTAPMPYTPERQPQREVERPLALRLPCPAGINLPVPNTAPMCEYLPNV